MRIDLMDWMQKRNFQILGTLVHHGRTCRYCVFLLCAVQSYKLIKLYILILLVQLNMCCEYNLDITQTKIQAIFLMEDATMRSNSAYLRWAFLGMSVKIDFKKLCLPKIYLYTFLYTWLFTPLKKQKQLLILRKLDNLSSTYSLKDSGLLMYVVEVYYMYIMYENTRETAIPIAAV